MSEKLPWLCRWWGHRWNDDALAYYAVLHCERCMRDYDDDPRALRWRIRVRWFLFRQWVGKTWRQFRYWLKCDDCGRRFGRHDESQDHIPF